MTKEVTPKRRKKNVENIVNYFGGRDKYNGPRIRALRAAPLDQVFGFIQLYSNNELAFEVLCAYVRKYRQAAQGEITLEDLKSAKELLEVKEVLEG